MKIWLLLSFALPTISLADIQGRDFTWQRPTSVQICRSSQREIKAWWSDQLNSNERVVPKEKIDRGLSILQQIQYPSKEDQQAVKSILNEKFGDAYLPWLLEVTDCPELRQTLGKALINSVEQNSALKPKIASAIKTALAANKDLRLIEASIDSSLLAYAFDHGLWKKNPIQAKQVDALQSDLKKDIRTWAERYSKFFSQIGSGLSNSSGDSPDSIAKFKALKDLNELKQGAFAEQSVTEKYLKRLRAIVEKLN